MLGGKIDSDKTGLLGGAVALPLGDKFGFQLDGAYGEIDNNTVWGTAGHMFWRNPNQGLFGIIASTSNFERTNENNSDIDVQRYGVEGEYYLETTTIASSLGYQTGDVNDTIYASLDFRHYFTNNLLGEIGVNGSSNDRVGRFAFEYAPTDLLGNRSSLFFDAGFGTDRFDYALTGIRIYFGESDKSLKRRHREDDPINTAITSITQSQEAVHEQRMRAAAPAGVSSSSGMVCTFPLLPDGMGGCI